MNDIALLWHIDNPKNIALELSRALTRFSMRPELTGRLPQKILFRPGETPAQIPMDLNGLQIVEAAHVPPGGYFKLV